MDKQKKQIKLSSEQFSDFVRDSYVVLKMPELNYRPDIGERLQISNEHQFVDNCHVKTIVVGKYVVIEA